MQKNNIINDWLGQHGDPETEQFIEKNLEICEKVRIALEQKGWTKRKFAGLMNKKPSEVSRWLSGMHNLTLKSIIKMEQTLGIDLIHCCPEKEYEYIFLGSLKTQDEVNADEYKVCCESQYYEIAL